LFDTFSFAKIRHMVVRRTTFFLSLFGILFILLLPNKLIWLMTSKKTTGVFAFQGRGNALEQITLPFSEIYFRLGKDTVWFKGPGKIGMNPGTLVPVRYQPDNPANAKVMTFFGFWGDTAIYGGIILLLLLAIFLHPGIVPRRASLRLSFRKPFLQIV
jgi:hypothetical protein